MIYKVLQSLTRVEIAENMGISTQVCEENVEFAEWLTEFKARDIKLNDKEVWKMS